MLTRALNAIRIRPFTVYAHRRGWNRLLHVPNATIAGSRQYPLGAASTCSRGSCKHPFWRIMSSHSARVPLSVNNLGKTFFLNIDIARSNRKSDRQDQKPLQTPFLRPNLKVGSHIVLQNSRSRGNVVCWPRQRNSTGRYSSRVPHRPRVNMSRPPVKVSAFWGPHLPTVSPPTFKFCRFSGDIRSTLPRGCGY
jgi:hypothetical protein